MRGNKLVVVVVLDEDPCGGFLALQIEGIELHPGIQETVAFGDKVVQVGHLADLLVDGESGRRLFGNDLQVCYGLL